MNKKPIKIAYIVDEFGVAPHYYDTLKEHQKTENYIITLLIVNKKQDSKTNSLQKQIRRVNQIGLAKTTSKIFFRFISLLEKLTLKIIGKYSDDSLKSINKLSIDKLFVAPNISKSGLIYEYDDNAIQQILSHKVDLIFRAGGGFLKGEILNCCRFGVLSYHHGNNTVNRGGPPGFWEVYHGQPSTGFVVQQLNNELDGGNVIFKGNIATIPIYSLNRQQINKKSSAFLPHIFNNLEQYVNSNAFPSIPYYHKLFKSPSTMECFYYIFQVTKYSWLKIIKKLASKKIDWSISYQFTENWKTSVLHKSTKITNPDGRFLADPFVVKIKDHHIIFAEDYNYKLKIGKISAWKINKKGHQFIGLVLDEKFHLSFPYVFSHNNQHYMCPETKQISEIRIYKANHDLTKWVYHKTLIDNINAVDSIIIQHEKIWWILTTVDTAGSVENNSELHIFYSKHLQSGGWNPHPKNPIFIDSLKGRNGGFIKEKGSIFRIGQKQGYGIYGEQASIFKITSLTAEDYKEEKICKLSPEFRNQSICLHTFNFEKGLMVFDQAEYK